METLKPLTTFRGFPSTWSDSKIISHLATKYGVNTSDFVVYGGVFTYKPKVKKTTTAKTLRKKQSITITNIVGEEWKPLPNKGRYFNGELDPTHLVQVSNMGRIAVGDKLVSTYFAETRNAMQVHIDTLSINGLSLKTTGFVANMIVDAFVLPNGRDGRFTYTVMYKDNNPQNCTLSNLIVIEK